MLDERARPESDGWLVTERRLRQTAGLCHQGDVDPGVSAIVAACDGSRRLGDILADVAEAADVAAADVRAAAAADHPPADRAGVPVAVGIGICELSQQVCAACAHSSRAD